MKKRAPKVEKVKGPTPTELKLALAEANRTISAITRLAEEDTRHVLHRAFLAESAHRAMAEALTVAGREGYCTDDRGRVMSSRSSPLAVISAWAGRGMTDKPENDGQVASGGGLAHGGVGTVT